jgi:methionyl-tRNA formyltransferase
MSSIARTRLVFMGSDAIALPTLRCLIEDKGQLGIEAVYTQPDRPRGRGKKVQPNAIKIWATEHGIPMYQPDSFGVDEVQCLLDLDPDIILVMAYGHLLPQGVLDVAPLGIYNIHTSLLPKLRGASPIETAVASGLSESGVSLMKLVMKMDAGPICGQERIPIESLETGGSYRDKMEVASSVLLERSLKGMLDGSIESEPQDEDAVTYCRLLVKQDGQLDFGQSARVLSNRINGLNPWPGCYAQFEDMDLKLGLAGWSTSEDSYDPGLVVECGSNQVSVGTGEGLLNLLMLQKAGGKMLPTETFLRGYPITPGSRFSSSEMHPLESLKPFSRKRVFQLYRKP